MTGRARARTRARAWARVVIGGKIINMVLLIPPGALYTMGAPNLKLKGARCVLPT